MRLFAAFPSRALHVLTCIAAYSVFRTSHKDVNINETSSYVDLAPLYGHNEEAQKKIRVFDGRGLLKPDTFAEDRLLLLPPAVCVLLVLFNRNHNVSPSLPLPLYAQTHRGLQYIARKLLELNERCTYKDPNTLSQSSSEFSTQEEDLFQTARLINCAWFASAVFSDYFSAILGLVREGNSWSLNPFEEIRNADHSLFERGRGNVCSVEFNCLYRWHATTSEADEKWVEQLSEQLFPGRTVEQVRRYDALASIVSEHRTGDRRRLQGSRKDHVREGTRCLALDIRRVSAYASPGDALAKLNFIRTSLQRDEKTNRFDDGALADILKNA